MSSPEITEMAAADSNNFSGRFDTEVTSLLNTSSRLSRASVAKRFVSPPSSAACPPQRQLTKHAQTAERESQSRPGRRQAVSLRTIENTWVHRREAPRPSPSEWRIEFISDLSRTTQRYEPQATCHSAWAIFRLEQRSANETQTQDRIGVAFRNNRILSTARHSGNPFSAHFFDRGRAGNFQGERTQRAA